jgi:hypothetical protein
MDPSAATWLNVAASAGRESSTPVAQVPLVSVRTRASVLLPELVWYVPAALQFPAEGHETEATPTDGFAPEFAGGVTSKPTPHTPEL